MDALYRHITADPAFRELQARRSRFVWTLTFAMLGIFFSYILTIAFQPQWLAVPLHSATVITWGIVIGLGIIAAALLLTAIYIVRCNRDFDPATAAIIADAKAKTS